MLSLCSQPLCDEIHLALHQHTVDAQETVRILTTLEPVYGVSGAVLGTGDDSENKTDHLCPEGDSFKRCLLSTYSGQWNSKRRGSDRPLVAVTGAVMAGCTSPLRVESGFKWVRE